MSKEERSGYKAQIEGMGSNVDKSFKSSEEPSPNRFNVNNYNEKQEVKTEEVKKASSDIEDNYEDNDFEDDIAEDLPVDDFDIEGSGNRLPSVAKIGESHGITVS